jgi:transposase
MLKWREMVKQKRYDVGFKINAVEMVLFGGKKISEVSQQLGVSVVTLSKWKKLHVANMGSVKRNGVTKSAEELELELRRLRKEFRDLSEERDILKKAMSIFAARPTADMR